MNQSAKTKWMVFSLATLGVLTVLASSVQAAEVEGPLEVAAFGADVVAVGEITSEPVKQHVQELQLPDQHRASEMDVRIFDMKVTQVLKDSRDRTGIGAPAAIPAAGTLRLLVWEVGEGNIRLPAKPLAKGQKLVVAAFSLPGREELYVPGMAAYRLEAATGNVEQVRAALNTDKWAWGKAENGLQLAALVPTPTALESSYPPVMADREHEGQRGLNIMIHTGIALRNNSDKPVTVPLRDMLATLRLSATSAGDITTTASISDPTRIGRQELPETMELPPGGVLLLGPKGLMRFGCLTEVIVQYGKVTFRARAAVGDHTIESAGVSAEIRRIPEVPDGIPH